LEAELVIHRLKEKDKIIAVAESCTGGLFSGALTGVPGSSECFGYGLVTYSNQAKHELLGIPWDILEEFGAVSYQTAYWMAKSIKEIAHAQLGLSITGIAGPSGGSEKKPVGLVYIALAEDKFCTAHKFLFKGTREEIRASTVKKGLEIILEHLK
jgi:PncC family amidohydrolase